MNKITRLMYFALTHLHLSVNEFWCMRFGLLLDLWECYRQEQGFAKPLTAETIDEVIPPGI